MTPLNAMEALGIYTSKKEEHEAAMYVRKAMLNNLSNMCRQAEDRDKIDFVEMRSILDSAEKANAQMSVLVDEINRAAQLCGRKGV